MRRLVLLVLSLLLVAFPSVADEGQKRPGFNDGVSNGGGGGGDAGPGTGVDPWVPPCPGFAMGPVQSYVGGGSDMTGPLFAVSYYVCLPDRTPIPTFNCIANCPPGAPPYIPPPSADAVFDRISDLAPLPVPAFAPPLQEGAFGVVGKRIYFSTSPESYAPTEPQIAFAGPWWVTGRIEPLELQFTIPGHPTKSCQGPGKDATTSEGRADNPCYILVEEAPPGYSGQITVSIKWRVTVVKSNIDGLSTRVDEDVTSTSAIVDIKELQAVVVG
jgi:hypothetical protein